MQRRGHFRNNVVDSGTVLKSYQGGNSISEKALPVTEAKAPNFDPRARRTPNAGGVGSGFRTLLRGKLVQYRQEAYPMRPGAPKLQRSVNFLYNPEQVAANYSFDPSQYPAESQQSEYAIPVLGATGQTISWVLYFNRMYEYASDRSQNNMGVLADIQAIEYLMGSKDGGMQSMVECMAIFGATRNLKPFAYIGYLSDVNVTYTHFSNRMIPLVAKVEIGMVRRFMGNSQAMTSDGTITTSPIAGGGSPRASDAATGRAGKRITEPPISGGGSPRASDGYTSPGKS